MRRRPMTSKQPDPQPEASAVRLQRMRFELLEQDHNKAVYRAFMKNDGAACALTVTVAPPGDEVKKLQEFMDDVRAGFVLVPDPAEDTGDDPKSVPELDLNKQVLFEVGVPVRTPDGLFGAFVVVETAVAGEDTDPGEDPDPRVAEFRAAPEHQRLAAAAYLQAKVLAGKDHLYRASGGVVRTATITALSGTGTVRSPIQTIKVGGGGKKVTGTTAVVHGVTACAYRLAGPFTRA